MKSKSDIIDMMECKHCRNGHLFLSRIWWSTVRNPNHAHSPFASLLLHTGQGESADDSSKLKNQKSRLDRFVSAIFSAFASALCQKMLSLKMSWHLKVFNDSDGKLFRLTSFCAGPQGHQQRIGRRDVSVMCQYVSLHASWCRVKKTFHFISFDAIWQINWCHLMSLDASSVTCQCANRFCLVEESTQSRDDFLECMRTAPDRPGIVPFFQGEDELFETGWMCNLFYLYGSELTYRHLCASLLCTECSWPRWPRWLVRILCIYAQSGPNERWEYLRVCGLSHASRICGVATDFGPRCDPKLGRFRGVV